MKVGEIWKYTGTEIEELKTGDKVRITKIENDKRRLYWVSYENFPIDDGEYKGMISYLFLKEFSKVYERDK